MCGRHHRQYDLNDPRQAAQKRVDEKKGFYRHLGVYVILNAFFAIPAIFSGHFPNMGMTFFWGIGLAIHYVNVFGLGFIHGQDWEEREIKREMRKMGYEERDGEVRSVDIDSRLQKRDPGRGFDESQLV